MSDLLLPSLKELAQDAFGNFAVQQLIDCSEKSEIAQILTPVVPSLAL